MKAEINNENRAKFFALYWGQLVMGGSWRHALEALYPITFDSIGKCHNYHLQLKSLSAISDEDAIEVGRLNGSVTDNDLLVGKSICHWLDKRGANRDITFEAVDYLRSKGYALPWLGLSVEEMIETGWVKLIKQ